MREKVDIPLNSSVVHLALNGVFQQVIFQFEHILKSSENHLRCLMF